MSQERARKGLTRRKLQEAEFFLGFLKPSYTKEKKFDFYLGAFFNAARSVLLVMNWEYKRTPGWKQWHKERKLDPEEERVFKGTTKIRNRLQKRGNLVTLKEAIVSGVYIPDVDKVEVNNLLERVAKEGVLSGIGGSTGKTILEYKLDGRRVRLFAREIMFDRRLEEFPNEHILTVCKNYYDSLAAIVKECESRFG